MELVFLFYPQYLVFQISFLPAEEEMPRSRSFSIVYLNVGVILFVLSCVVYGFAFDFFNISGALYVDQETEPAQRSSAQGLFMMMTNGLGATIGTLAAGEVVNSFCSWEGGYLVGDWQTCWFVFSAFALVVGVTFAFVFNPEKKKA